MSERLWLGPTPARWATVNLCEQPDTQSAIRAISKHYGQVLKVSGPIGRLREVYAVWKRMAHDPDALMPDDFIPDPDEADWWVRESLDDTHVAFWDPETGQVEESP